ncbi:MAG: hypothetical protein QOI12_2421 [Alphaproteobacteria bacterium]|jgi:uncharacterized protein (TIGR02118 family)|nr:hypothetical protein [Alphaproteobacteria bacterium]
MVKLTVLYGHPKNPADFEKYYEETHSPIAEQIRGVRRLELAKFVGTPDGGRAAYYRSADVYFDNHDHMKSVLATPEAQRAMADIPNFATGGVTVMVAEVM